MSRSGFIFFCMIVPLALGCPRRDPGLRTSSGLSPQQKEDIPMLRSLLEEQGYRFEVALRDADQSGAIDIELNYRSGHEGESAGDILTQLASLVGFTMAGCGYPTDQLVVNLRGKVYQAPMSECARCAFDTKTQAERIECLKGLWSNSLGARTEPDF